MLHVIYMYFLLYAQYKYYYIIGWGINTKSISFEQNIPHIDRLANYTFHTIILYSTHDYYQLRTHI